MNNRTLVIRAKKHTGTITTLASVFSRRNIAVELMFCSALHDAAEMVCTVTYQQREGAVCMLPLISKMHDVIDVYYGE